jgi:hypothetical protein
MSFIETLKDLRLKRFTIAGTWDSPAWGQPNDDYDYDHPELNIWPPE